MTFMEREEPGGTTLHPELATLLRGRETVIADHDWRDRDPADHLAALIRISERINEWSVENRNRIDARLRHYLDNASYGKALTHLESGGTAPHHA